ncbi:MAG: hypothetical protein KAH86_05005 [Methanosarcinales archaeon]|nr:hypothetical protein [Methanosarcinales archaeon]
MDIRLARPCVDDPSRYIAESRFPQGFDMNVLCAHLRKSGMSNLKCSKSLGVARFELDDKQVMLYRNGRVDVRRTIDVDDARQFLKKLETIVACAFVL